MSGTKRRYEQLQPQLQRDIVHDCRRGVHGYIAIAQKHQLPRSNSSICDRARSERAVAPSQQEEAEQRRAGEVVAVVLTETLSPHTSN